MSDQIETLLNEVDAARALNLAVNTLRNWRVRGIGPAFVKLGGAVRYSPHGLRDYISARTRQPISLHRPDLTHKTDRV